MMQRVLEMNDPRGIDVDPTTGDIYAVSAYKNRIYRFDYPTGQLVAVWSEVDGTGDWAGNAKFDSIRFVAVDGQGNVYTGDTWGERHPRSADGGYLDGAPRLPVQLGRGAASVGDGLRAAARRRLQPEQRDRGRGRRGVRARDLRPARAEVRYVLLLPVGGELPGVAAPVRVARATGSQLEGVRVPARPRVRGRVPLGGGLAGCAGVDDGRDLRPPVRLGRIGSRAVPRGRSRHRGPRRRQGVHDRHGQLPAPGLRRRRRARGAATGPARVHGVVRERLEPR
ncbi:MAG: hypothetical protein KatS3mg014_1657 [Actinomycetota bacterium]|nr:MAG: hypothetical protein KatS3mg014_1657 [Actinomycetota bacterium]